MDGQPGQSVGGRTECETLAECAQVVRGLEPMLPRVDLPSGEQWGGKRTGPGVHMADRTGAPQVHPGVSC